LMPRCFRENAPACNGEKRLGYSLMLLEMTLIRSTSQDRIGLPNRSASCPAGPAIIVPPSRLRCGFSAPYGILPPMRRHRHLASILLAALVITPLVAQANPPA